MRRFLFAVAVAFLLSISGPELMSAPQPSAKRALEANIPDLRFDNISLSDAINFLRDTSGVNFHVNWSAIEAAGITKETTINIRLRSVSLKKILNLVLNEAGHGTILTYYIDDNVIEVTTRELADRQLIMIVYPVGDLIVEVPDFEGPSFQIQATQTGRGGGGGGNLINGNNTTNTRQNMTRNDLAQQLIDTIQAIIQPEIWDTNGGPAAMRFYNGSLIVTAPRSVHEALAGVLD
ncbi:MAG TPA: hypothetical protein VHD56_17275 [Tepidisphaeraceae bacterium]|nr:hypothetical protein [Tepidisphaeraceae bacterium]